MKKFYIKYEFWLWLIPALLVALFLSYVQALAVHASSYEFNVGGTTNTYYFRDSSGSGDHLPYFTIASSSVPAPLAPFELTTIGIQVSSGQAYTKNIDFILNGVDYGSRPAYTGPDTFFYADFSDLGIMVHPLDSFQVKFGVESTGYGSGSQVNLYATNSGGADSTTGNNQTSAGAYVDLNGGQIASANISNYFPGNLGNVQNWDGVFQSVVNLSNADVSATYQARVLYYIPHAVGTSSTTTDIPYIAENDIVAFPAIDTSHLIVGQEYDWQSLILKDGNIMTSSTPTNFIYSSAANPIPSSAVDIATATMPIFAPTTACPDGSASSTFSIISCNVSNFIKNFINDVADYVVSVLNAIKNVIVNGLFPLNVFTHLNNDFTYAANNPPATAPVMDLQFGAHDLVFLSSSTIDQAGSAIAFDFRTIEDYVMWVLTAGLIIIIAGYTFVHMKDRHKGSSNK